MVSGGVPGVFGWIPRHCDLNVRCRLEIVMLRMSGDEGLERSLLLLYVSWVVCQYSIR